MNTSKKIHYILGVDSAWTEANPSGVALLKYDKAGKKPWLIKAARSFEEFCYDKLIDWSRPATGSIPDFQVIIEYCKDQGYRVDVVALDMPLSPKTIISRRAADREISRQYGGRGTATHSPSEHRPGEISKNIFKQLKKCGFLWEGKVAGTYPSFIEVYPHVAILELWNYQYRVPYKVQNRGKYWPNASPEERKKNIVNSLLELCGRLVTDVDNVEAHFNGLLDVSQHVLLKGYEDMLDAAICALAGMRYLQKRAKPYGDDHSAIWVPDK